MTTFILSRKLFMAILTVILLLYGISGVAALTTQELAKIALDSTLYLQVDLTEDQIKFGSGFVIGEGLIATNHHVIEGATAAAAKLIGEDTVYRISSIRIYNEITDLAIIKVDKLNGTPLQLGDSDTVFVGQEIYVAGNPLGQEDLEGTFSDGIISGIRDVNGVRLLQMTAPVSPGNSGGPVINSDGEVIGISVSTIVDGQNLNFAVPVNQLKQLITESTDFPHTLLKYDFANVNDISYTAGSVEFSPDGNNIVSGSTTGILRKFDAETGELIVSGHLTSPQGEGIWDLDYSLDGSFFAAAGHNGTSAILRIYDGNLDDAPIHSFPFNQSFGELYSISFSPDSKYLAWSFSKTATVYVLDLLPDDADDNLRYITSGSASAADGLEFSPDSRYIGIGRNDGVIILAEVEKLWENTLEGLQFETGDVVHDISFSPDGKYLAANGSFSNQKRVNIWDLTTRDIIKTIDVDEEYTIYDVSFSPDPDSQFLAYGGTDGKINLHRTDDSFTRVGEILALHPVFSVAWSTDASLISNGRMVWEITENMDVGGISTEETQEVDPVTMTTPTVSFSPSPVTSPYLGGQLTISLNISDAENVTGYSTTIQFDSTALRYLESENGNYLHTGGFFNATQPAENQIYLTATAISKQSSDGNGTLATLTFEVINLKPSTLTITQMLLSDPEGITTIPEFEDGQINVPQHIKGDVNRDGVVNISDLVLVASLMEQTGELGADVNDDGIVNISDLVIVAGEITEPLSAPSLLSQNNFSALTRVQVEHWLRQTQQLNPIDATFQRGIRFLEQLLEALTPEETALLANYPNPFNPETWIPYQLSKPADVTLTIYDIKGHVVRSLDLGHQRAGLYQTRSRAAHWDGRNALGEPAASGVYFYTLTAGDFTATRKMLIRK
ncbi:trypsin-like peptidase domain-containing protein [Candidatus Poribacteria bacterium]|nr:trypsin-like peptidase domain-containing protein [Candidatus Poribacteria bacterium]